jgi:hypothetical protein
MPIRSEGYIGNANDAFVTYAAILRYAIVYLHAQRNLIIEIENLHRRAQRGHRMVEVVLHLKSSRHCWSHRTPHQVVADDQVNESCSINNMASLVHQRKMPAKQL